MFDPNHTLSNPKFRKEQLLFEAGWRFQLVAPLLSTALDQETKTQLRRKLVTEPQKHPFRGAVNVSARSLRRWCQRYREKNWMACGRTSALTPATVAPSWLRLWRRPRHFSKKTRGALSLR